MDDAKDRLAARRAKEHADTLQAHAEARSAAFDALGASIGTPVNFAGPPPPAQTGSTKAPKVAPRHPAGPPKETMTESYERTLDESQTDKDDYNESLRAAGIPVPPPANPDDFRSKRRPRDVARVQHKKPAHPLLSQLRSEFGISDANKPVDVRVADHVWTFVPLSPDLIALAARVGDVMSQTSGEHALRTKQAAVCFSIVAVDSVPVWLMLGIEPTLNDNVEFPLIPKGPIRQNAAVALYGELTGGMKNRLLEALYEAYVAKVDTDNSVASYTTYEKVEHVVWVCSEDGCDHKFTKPRRYEGTDELPYFCELHGTEMIDISTTRPRIDEDLRPLV